MKRKIIRGGVKAFLFTACFAIIFLILQRVVAPKSEGISAFYEMEEGSIDVLFLGSSQMFCTANAQKLTEEYGISSYDFGASSQPLTTTCYYLEEALKTQKPKAVLVEVCGFFYDLDGPDAHPGVQTITWSYAAMPYSREKWRSLYEVLDGDAMEAAKYCLFPLWAYHSRWNEVNGKDLFPAVSEQTLAMRGFCLHDTSMAFSMAYTGADPGEECQVPHETDKAITRLGDMCREHGIALVFFKAPVPTWTRNESKAVKAYMQEHGLTYLELNDYLEEIGIDPETDFVNESHLNTIGANKTTAFLAEYLQEHFPELASNPI